MAINGGKGGRYGLGRGAGSISGGSPVSFFVYGDLEDHGSGRSDFTMFIMVRGG